MAEESAPAVGSSSLPSRKQPASQLLSVRGKRVLVTGASQGIGRAMAMRLAEEGAHVVALARRREKLVELCEQINGGRADKAAVPVDVDLSSGEADVEEALSKAWAEFGGLDVVLHCAGTGMPWKPALDHTFEEFNQVMMTNLRGAWMVSKGVAKRMVAAGIGGSLINLVAITVAGRGLIPNLAAYTSAGGGVVDMTKALALELGPHGIRANTLALGVICTEETAELAQSEESKKFQRQLPMRRFAHADPDLVGPIILLASDAGAYVTGTTVIVDGGHSLVQLDPSPTAPDVH